MAITNEAGPLRPAYGSGEDWNHVDTSRRWEGKELRPAYGSGEDWNIWYFPGVDMTMLRPAYGSGEDWSIDAVVKMI